MTNLVFALVIATVGTTAVFDTREQCMSEARAVNEQGAKAYCVPMNQITPEQAQRQIKDAINMLNGIMKELESR